MQQSGETSIKRFSACGAKVFHGWGKVDIENERKQPE